VAWEVRADQTAQHGRVAGWMACSIGLCAIARMGNADRAGRISVRRGGEKTPPSFRDSVFQRKAGRKCLFTGQGRVQEVSYLFGHGWGEAAALVGR